MHVTWRMRDGVWNLRSQRCFTALARAFWGGASRFGFKLVHYSVQGNHVHLLVEAESEKSLARGMCGLGVRVARGLNRVMGRRGKVLDDRYHGHILRTPTEVRRARAYLLAERAEALRATRARRVHVERRADRAGYVSRCGGSAKSGERPSCGAELHGRAARPRYTRYPASRAAATVATLMIECCGFTPVLVGKTLASMT